MYYHRIPVLSDVWINKRETHKQQYKKHIEIVIRKKYTFIWVAVFIITSACNFTESSSEMKIRVSVSSQFLRPREAVDISIQMEADDRSVVPDGTLLAITTNRGSFSKEDTVLSVNKKTRDGLVYVILYLDESLGQISLKIQSLYLTEIRHIAFVSETW